MDFHYIHTPGGVFVVPITRDGKVVMIKQPRHLPHRIMLEFPGGGIKPGQTPAQAARAEVKEETGYTVEKLVPLGRVASWVGVSDEISYLYLGYVGERGKTEHDPLEEGIEVLVRDKKEIDALMQGSLMWDAQSVSAWFMARRFLK